MKLTQQQAGAARYILQNASTGRTLSSILGNGVHASTKHNFNFDFGYKVTLQFEDLYQLYKRNGVAKALVNKTVAKTWETQPVLVVGSDKHDQTPEEKAIADRFEQLRFWQQLAESDRRGLVGEYAGVIFQLADGKEFSDPVDTIPNGLDGLINIIPAWEGQLTVSQWNNDKTSADFGKPMTFSFVEAAVDTDQGKTRAFNIHPDRVFVWSRDGTTFNDSELEASHDALVDMIKIRGAGGEGFWKNAKSQPVLEATADVDFTALAAIFGTDVEGLPEKLDEAVSDWNKGFDQSLVLQGMTAKTLSVDLPQPKEFYDIAAREAAAPWSMPEKVLFGNQTGERASTEDAASWNRANMSRRVNVVTPNITGVVERLVSFGVLQENDWFIDWEDLTGATKEQKFATAKTMSEINRNALAGGEIIFDASEIREAVDLEGEADDIDDLTGEDEPDD